MSLSTRDTARQALVMARSSSRTPHRSGLVPRVNHRRAIVDGPPRRIVIAAFPDVQVLDVTGPLEVFGRTARWLVEQGHRTDLAYTIELAGPQPGPLPTSSGLKLVADLGYRDVKKGIDTLL